MADEEVKQPKQKESPADRAAAGQGATLPEGASAEPGAAAAATAAPDQNKPVALGDGVGNEALETVASIENQLGEVLANLNQLAGSAAKGGALAADRPAASIDLLRDVQLTVKIELGHTRMRIEDILKLGEGSVVELDKLAGDPVDVFVNDRLVARGEVLVLNDNFCVRIGELISQE